MLWGELRRLGLSVSELRHCAGPQASTGAHRLPQASHRRKRALCRWRCFKLAGGARPRAAQVPALNGQGPIDSNKSRPHLTGQVKDPFHAQRLDEHREHMMPIMTNRMNANVPCICNPGGALGMTAGDSASSRLCHVCRHPSFAESATACVSAGPVGIAPIHLMVWASATSPPFEASNI